MKLMSTMSCRNIVYIPVVYTMMTERVRAQVTPGPATSLVPSSTFVPSFTVEPSMISAPGFMPEQTSTTAPAPVFRPSPVTSTSTSTTITNSTNKSGLSSGAIFGIAIAVIVGLILLVGLCYLIRKQNLEQPPSAGNANGGGNIASENPAEPIDEYQGIRQQTTTNDPIDPITTNLQQQKYATVTTPRPDPPTDYVVSYKDQSRSVIAPTPIVQAIPDSKNQSNDATIIPFASAVAHSKHE